MARQIAIEWDEQHLRLLVANVSVGKVKVERVEVIPIQSTGTAESAVADALGQSDSDATGTKQLVQAIQDAKIGRGDALVTVRRSGTEMRVIEVPYATEAEMPSLVRFQAQRQLASMGDDWGLDYLPMSKSIEGEPSRVFAVAMSGTQMAQIKSICEQTSLNLNHIHSRPFALGTLFEQMLPSEKTRLCIDTYGEEGELIVLNGNQFEMVRTIRLARDEQGQINGPHLIGEIRRTLMAYGNQADRDQVTQIVVCGTEDDLSLANEIQNSLNIEANVFDPFQAVDVARGALESTGQHRRYFAGLIGSLLQCSSSSTSAIDFLNPRKPPAQTGQQRRNVLIGATVGVVVFAVVGYFALLIYLASAREASLRKQVNARLDIHEKVVDRVADFDQLESFNRGAQFNWLTEFEQASVDMPAEGVIVDNVNFSLTVDNKATMTINGRATEPSMITQLERNLRSDERFRVQPKSNEHMPDEPIYPWRFGETIAISEPKSSNDEDDEPGPQNVNEVDADVNPDEANQVSTEQRDRNRNRVN